jgi:hypothetical protein
MVSNGGLTVKFTHAGLLAVRAQNRTDLRVAHPTRLLLA